MINHLCNINLPRNLNEDDAPPRHAIVDDYKMAPASGVQQNGGVWRIITKWRRLEDFAKDCNEVLFQHLIVSSS